MSTIYELNTLATYLRTVRKELFEKLSPEEWGDLYELVAENFVSEDELDDIKESSYDNGYSDGRDAAYDDAYYDGEQYGYERGHEDGHENGYDEGYQAGYDAGKADAIEDA